MALSKARQTAHLAQDIVSPSSSAAQGVDPMENFGYRKVKELDDKINALRAAL